MASVTTDFSPPIDAFYFNNSWTFTQNEISLLVDSIGSRINDAALGLAEQLPELLGPEMLKVATALGVAIPAVPGGDVGAGILLGAVGGLVGLLAPLVAPVLGPALLDPASSVEVAKAVAEILKVGLHLVLSGTYGRCGGMAFTAKDYFLMNWCVPQGDPATIHFDDKGALVYALQPQEAGSESARQLRSYIFTRLLDSLYGGVAERTVGSILVYLLPFSIGSKILRDQVPSEFKKAKALLNQGIPATLVLIGDSANPLDQHQVLAIGYNDAPPPYQGLDWTGMLEVYDNNKPGERHYIYFSTTRDDALEAYETAYGGIAPGRGPLRFFFVSDYTLKVPPVAVGVTSSVDLSEDGPLAGPGSSIIAKYRAVNFQYCPSGVLELGIRRTRAATHPTPQFVSGEPMAASLAVLEDSNAARSSATNVTFSSGGSYTLEATAMVFDSRPNLVLTNFAEARLASGRVKVLPPHCSGAVSTAHISVTPANTPKLVLPFDLEFGKVPVFPSPSQPAVPHILPAPAQPLHPHTTSSYAPAPSHVPVAFETTATRPVDTPVIAGGASRSAGARFPVTVTNIEPDLLPRSNAITHGCGCTPSGSDKGGAK